jgi:hypothetical protein
LPVESMTLVIRDDRGSRESAGFAGLGEVLKREPAAMSTPAGNAVGSAVGLGLGLAKVFKTESSPTPRHFVSPNDVHIQYFRWTCISNCFPPEFRWFEQAKEKYELTSFLKVYGGYTPDRDGEVISIKGVIFVFGFTTAPLNVSESASRFTLATLPIHLA